MRPKMPMTTALILLFGLGPLVAPAGAQDVGETVALTGCLAEDDDGDEYELRGVADDATAAEEIELMAGEGVNLANHVGHTVEAIGTVVADDDAEGEDDGAEDDADDMEDMADEDDDLHVRVTTLNHVAASCD